MNLVQTTRLPVLDRRSKKQRRLARRNQHALRPCVEALEARSLLAAIVAGFNTSTLAPTDDGSTSAVPLGFTANFFGATTSTVYVNNNGNVTFNSGQSTFIPYALNQATIRPILAPFFSDVDTRSAGSPVTYGTGTVGGRAAFGVNWVNVDYFPSSAQHAYRNSFQLIMIDRSDVAAGSFDFEFNYDQIQWENSGTGRGGSSTVARVGYSNGTGEAGTNFEFAGSGVAGAFLDFGPANTQLIANQRAVSGQLNSAVNGRYYFQVRNGSVQPTVTFTSPTTANYSGVAYTPTVAITGALGPVTNPIVTYSYYSGTSASGTPLSGSPVNVGTYTVVASFAGNINYAARSNTLTFTIAPARLSVSGITANSKYFDGTTTATFDTSAAVLTGFVGFNEQAFVSINSVTGSFATATVGSNKPVAVTSIVLGGSAAGNYVVNPLPTGLTANIASIPITVTQLLVTSASDDVTHTGVSLRDALTIAAADTALGKQDNITFAPNLSGQTITLIQGPLLTTATRNLGTITIDGAGRITVSGNNQSNVFVLNAGVHVALNGLTIIRGNTTSADTGFNSSGNSGGGIYNAGILTVNNTRIFSNYALYAGGGIYNAPGASLTVTNSSIFSNISGSASDPVSGQGGGIFNASNLTLINSTLTNNSTGAIGGGLFNAATATITQSTISGNTAAVTGGLRSESGLVLLNSIVANNSSAFGSAPDTSVAGSFVAANSLLGTPDQFSNSVVNGTNGNQVGTLANPLNPRLDVLANYGGPTPTLPLLAGSPAINAGGAVTTLTTAVNATGTNFPLGTVALPSALSSTTGPLNLVVRVDQEQLLITVTSATSFTVQRGYNGSTPATHNAGAGVYLVFDQTGRPRDRLPDLGAYEYQVPPTITNLGGTVNYNGGAAAIVVAPTALVTAGNQGVANSTLTVSLLPAGQLDVLTIQSNGLLNVSGNTLRYNNTIIGTFTPGLWTTPLVVSFNSAATTAAVQAVVNNVTFGNSAPRASAFDRGVSFQLTDSAGITLAPAVKAIHLNAPPTISSLGGTVNYTGGASAVLVAPTATVTAGDNGLAGATLTVALQPAGGLDVLTVQSNGLLNVTGNTLRYNGTAIGTFTAGLWTAPLVVSFNSSATTAAVQAVLNNVQFSNTAPGAPAFDRTISFLLADGKGLSLAPSPTKTIRVT